MSISPNIFEYDKQRLLRRTQKVRSRGDNERRTMEINRCIHCMEEIDEHAAACPHCGAEQEVPEHYTGLQPKTILHRRYLIGLLLEELEDTYIAFDLTERERVFIKEFFPLHMVEREDAAVVPVKQYQVELEQGLSEFLLVGNALLQQPDRAAMPRAREVFEANSTAYIALDPPELPRGTVLKSYVEKNGPLEYDLCVRSLLPLVKDLARLHRAGVVHRRIDPQHIWVSKAADGQRDSLSLSLSCPRTLNDPFSSSCFAPLEMYIRKAEKGPWCDVYALCAVLYLCLTGEVPSCAPDRLETDKLSVRLNQLIFLPQEQVNVIIDGMALHSKDRIQSMEELGKRLESAMGKEPLAKFPQTVYAPPPRVFSKKPQYDPRYNRVCVCSQCQYRWVANILLDKPLRCPKCGDRSPHFDYGDI